MPCIWMQGAEGEIGRLRSHLDAAQHATQLAETEARLKDDMLRSVEVDKAALQVGS